MKLLSSHAEVLDNLGQMPALKDLIVDINGNPLSLEMMMREMLDMPLADAMNL